MSETYDGATVTFYTTAGDMTFEFFPDKAPGHVKNFIELSEKGFYDGTSFHRIIPGFMIQGGCPKGDGTGGPGYTVDAEFNDVSHVRGILSMARTSDPNSAGSQFFVMHGTSPHLDNQYTAFGKLTDGDETLEAIASAETQPGGEGSRPKAPVQVTRVTVTRKQEA